ncbi:MAG: hypothetical protein U0903_08020 [Planctomycetales bacterium]
MIRFSAASLGCLFLGLSLWGADPVAPDAKTQPQAKPAEKPANRPPAPSSEVTKPSEVTKDAPADKPASENAEPAKTPDTAEKKDSPPPEKPIPPELRPYRVLVRLMVKGDSRISSERSVREFGDEIHEALKRLWGECWQITTVLETKIQPFELDALESVSPEWLLKNSPPEPYDKQFLVLIAPQGGLWQVAAREWDVASQRLTPVTVRDSLELRDLQDASARLMSELFHPLLVIEDVDKTTIYIRPRGGVFPPADPDLKLFEPKSYWLPFYHTKFTTDEGTTREQAQMIPWTYLQLESFPNPKHREGTCKLITGLRNPVAPSRGPLSESLAIAVDPPGTSTRVTLLSRDQYKRPLAGMEVDLLPDEKTVSRTFLTDRAGSISLKFDPKNPLIWFRARSGTQRLAQLPLLPGAVDQVSLELPRDDIRLETEAKLALIQAQLMETVAKRSVLMARIKRVSNQSDWKTVDQMLKELQALPKAETVIPELVAIRATAITTAQKQKDKIAARRIEKMCDETRELVDHYLQDDKVKQMIEELDQLRKITKQEEKLTDEIPGVKKAP